MRNAPITNPRFIDAMTSPAARDAGSVVLVVPVGSTEQHGPHLPLTTDTDIAVALARRLAAQSEGVVVAPPVSYGSSGEHDGFPGTLSIGNAAIEMVLIELMRSAVLTWARVLLLSTHGGNNIPVRRAIERLRDEGRDVRAWFPTWGGDAHAGHTETSLMLSIAPERVDIAAAEIGASEPIEEIMATLRARGVVTVSQNGVLGDPTHADTDHGRRLLNTEVEQLVRLVALWPELTP